MVDFRLQRKSSVGLFCVAKKGDKQRLVVDCRPTNALFEDSPKTWLSTPAVLGQLSLPRTEGMCAPNISAVDLVDSFYLFEYTALAEYFAIQYPVTAGDMDITHALLDGAIVPVSAEQPVFACLTTLPMGFSWALHLCHAVLCNLMVAAAVDAFGMPRDEAINLLCVEGKP